MSQFDPVRYEQRGAAFVGGRREDLVSTEWERKTARVVVAGVGGVVLGALSLFLADIKDGSLLLFLIIGVLALAAVISSFEKSLVALLALAWVNIGSPAIAQGGSGGAQRLMISHMLISLLLAMWGGRLITRPQPHLKNPIAAPFTFYLFICIWSTANSFIFPNQAVLANSPKQYFQVNALEIFMRLLTFGAIFLLAKNLEGKNLKAGMIALALPGTLAALGLSKLVPSAEDWIGFPQIISMAILASFALDNGTRPLLRVIFGLLALYIFFVLFVIGAEWVSGWLGAGVALLIVSAHANPRLLRIALILIGLVVTLNFGYFYQKIYKENFYGAGPTHDRTRAGQMGTFNNDRLRMLGASMRYASTFPLGIGPGNYRSYNQYFGQINVWNTTTFTSAHGTYAQTLSETGFGGFIGLMWILIASGSMLRRFYRSAAPGPIRVYLLGTWGGVIGIFCASFNGDYLFPTYHNGGLGHFGVCLYSWMAIGVSMAIAREQGIPWSETTEKQEQLS